jgi:hypothetical protein
VYREYDLTTAYVYPTAFPSTVSFDCVTKVCADHRTLLFSKYLHYSLRH